MYKQIVMLSISKGALQGREYVFYRSATCVVGRGAGCLIRFENDESHLSISRRHCVFQIDPPRVSVRDLESLNGTFVNGNRLDQHAKPHELHDGDEVTLPRNTIIKVGVQEAEVEGPFAVIDDIEMRMNLGICPACFEVARTPDELIVAFVGRKIRLAPSHLHILGDHLNEIVDATGQPNLALIMSNLECLDSQAIGDFVRLHKKLVTLGGSLRLIELSPHLYEICEAAKVDNVLEMLSTEERIIHRH